jgi:hypothetical protein
MPECASCSVEDICDECSEGFYWIEKWGKCNAYVECTVAEYSEFLGYGE